MIRADGSLRIVPRLAVVALVLAGAALAAIDAITLLNYAAYTAVGTLLVTRRPRNSVSWLLLVIAAAYVGTSTPPDFDIEAVARGDAALRDKLYAWLGSWAGLAVWLAFAALAFVFPAGTLPAGRWRRPAVLLLAIGLAGVLVAMIAPTVTFSTDGITTVEVRNPLAAASESPIWDVLPTLDLFLELGVLAVSVAALLSRYRGATGVTRLQLRWLMAAITFLLLAVVAGLTLTVVAGDVLGGLMWIPSILAFPTIPLAIGVAVLRYRLYEIDRIVNRALVYGSVTAILAGVLAAAADVSQRLFTAVTGGTSDLAVVMTTLIVAALYTPVRTRVEAVIDQRFKYDHRQFGRYRDELDRLAELIDPARAAARLAREALAETRATGVAVTNANGVVLASAGQWPVDVQERIAVGRGDGPMVSILVGPRIDGRIHAPAVLSALADVGSVADVVLRIPSTFPGPGDLVPQAPQPQREPA